MIIKKGEYIMRDLIWKLTIAGTLQPCDNCCLKTHCDNDPNFEACIANCPFTRAAKLLQALTKEGQL